MEIAAATLPPKPSPKKNSGQEFQQLMKTLQGEVKSLRKMVRSQGHDKHPNNHNQVVDERAGFPNTKLLQL